MKKKMMIMVLSAAMLFSMAACGKAQTVTEPTTEENVQIANPFVEYANAEEVSKAIGFDFTVPEEANGGNEVLYQTCNTMFAEAIYYDGTGEEKARIRKGTGSEDISGDYTEYSETTTVTVGENSVTFKGENGNVELATWTSGDYIYSVSTTPISADAMSELVAQVQ